jgi:alpha-glucosidase
MTDLGAADLDREADMGTWGTGPFSSDGALDLLDELAGQPASQRREALERIFFRVRDRPDLLGRKFFPDEIVAAAAVVAASLPGGEGLRQDLADHGYDADAPLVPAPDPELNHSAQEALLVAAGRDGPWHDGWVDPQAAAQARQTIDRLAAIFLREEHSHDQELPLQY